MAKEKAAVSRSTGGPSQVTTSPKRAREAGWTTRTDTGMDGTSTAMTLYAAVVSNRQERRTPNHAQ